MAVIKVDPDWIAGYAQRVAERADDLAKGAELLNTAPLSAESFGELGRTVRTAEAYGRAADALRAQLTRGVEALESAAASLGEVAERYRVSDDDGAQVLRRSGRE